MRALKANKPTPGPDARAQGHSTCTARKSSEDKARPVLGRRTHAEAFNWHELPFLHFPPLRSPSNWHIKTAVSRSWRPAGVMGYRALCPIICPLLQDSCSQGQPQPTWWVLYDLHIQHGQLILSVLSLSPGVLLTLHHGQGPLPPCHHSISGIPAQKPQSCSWSKGSAARSTGPGFTPAPTWWPPFLAQVPGYLMHSGLSGHQSCTR